MLVQIPVVAFDNQKWMRCIFQKLIDGVLGYTIYVIEANESKSGTTQLHHFPARLVGQLNI